MWMSLHDAVVERISVHLKRREFEVVLGRIPIYASNHGHPDGRLEGRSFRWLMRYTHLSLSHPICAPDYVYEGKIDGRAEFLQTATAFDANGVFVPATQSPGAFAFVTEPCGGRVTVSGQWLTDFPSLDDGVRAVEAAPGTYEVIALQWLPAQARVRFELDGRDGLRRLEVAGIETLVLAHTVDGGLPSVVVEANQSVRCEPWTSEWSIEPADPG